MSSYGAFFLTMALTYAIICLGLNVQWGQTGLFNVGIAGFVAIGAYVSALLTTPDDPNRFGGFGLPIAVGWIGGALATGLVSFLIGALTIRLRADYLAIATFGVAVVVQLVALNLEPVTGGPFGIGFIPRPFAGLRRRSALLSASLNLGVLVAIVLVALSRARTPGAQPVGQGAARHPRGRAGGARARQERGEIPPAGLRHRRRHHGAGRRGAGAFHRLHRAGQLRADADLPGLGDADRRRLGQQSRRDPRRGAGLGHLGGLGRPPSRRCSRPAQQARAAALQIVMIGVALCAILLLRPRGILGEERVVSRHVGMPRAAQPSQPTEKTSDAENS